MSTRSKKSTRKINLQSSDALSTFFKDLKEEQRAKVFGKLKDFYGIELKINAVGMLVIKCPKEKSAEIHQVLINLNEQKKKITETDIEDAIELAVLAEGPNRVELIQQEDNYSVNVISFRKKNGEFITVKPKTENQAKFLEAIFTKKVAFGMGSPGTGKSFLALSAAMKLLYSKKIQKIIITKPAIEAGPSIGYLPGSMDEKLSAYASSFMGILAELIGADQRDKLIESKVIQIENIGFLRGMTVGGRDGVVFILDEAQNADFPQHKMILSRLGNHPESRVIYAGDQRQSDLKHKKDTLSLIHTIIKDSPYVGAVTFTKEDVVRSEVVKDLLGRIEDYEDKETGPKKPSK